MCIPCVSHMYSMSITCVLHGYFMNVPCVVHVAMCIPCVFHEYSMSMPCVRQTFKPNSSSDCVCDDDECDVRRYIIHTRTNWHTTHASQSTHIAHRCILTHPPPETKQAQQHKSHSTTHTTQHTKTTMHTARGPSQASFLAVNPQIARRHCHLSELHDRQPSKT